LLGVQESIPRDSPPRDKAGLSIVDVQQQKLLPWNAKDRARQTRKQKPELTTDGTDGTDKSWAALLLHP
jgi:hypothetical protein